MGKAKGCLRNVGIFIGVFFFGVIAMIVFMFATEGDQIDREGLNRGFVKQSLNVRSEANTDSKILKTLEPGDRFYIADTLDNGWYKMVLGSEESSFSREDESFAYVSGNYVFGVNGYNKWKNAYDKRKAEERERQERLAEKQREKEWNRTQSYSICRDFVRDRLKAPSTAEFPSITEVNIFDRGSNTFMVKGYVDAQNSFGAQIRNQFECEVRLEGETWHLRHIDLF